VSWFNSNDKDYKYNDTKIPRDIDIQDNDIIATGGNAIESKLTLITCLIANFELKTAQVELAVNLGSATSRLRFISRVCTHCDKSI
jgi:hypothetical protein